jgi:CHAT domain-containing protein
MRICYLFLVVASLLNSAYANESSQSLIQSANTFQQRGDYKEEVEHLRQALKMSVEPEERREINALLGDALLNLHQYGEAEQLLVDAEKSGTNFERAQIAIDLGNIKSRQGQIENARRQYRKAITWAADAPELQWVAQLNLIILEKPNDRLPKLQQLSSQLASITDRNLHTRLAISLGAQAHAIGEPGNLLAYKSYDEARLLAQEQKDARRQAEALDGLGQLYEEQQSPADSMRLTEKAIEIAQREGALDLLIGLEARQGRLLRAGGKAEEARAVFKHAIDNIHSIRLSIPVEFRNGRSSFRDTLEPIYLQYADLLLEKGNSSSGSEQQQYFRQAQNTLENLKRAELDDYLGDRCTVMGGVGSRVDVGTAILYPVMFKGRVDLLLETSEGLFLKSTLISSDSLRIDALRFASLLRDGNPLGNLPGKLYEVLMLPIEPLLSGQHIETLVVVPDGALRMVPFGALHDGQDYLVEKYAIAVVPGLSMLVSTQSKTKGKIPTLLAGMSVPGGVVSKFKPEMLDIVAPDVNAVPTRSLSQQVRVRDMGSLVRNAPREEGGSGDVDVKREAQLRASLALPGVEEEIDSLSKITNGLTLLNGSFTLNGFHQQLASGGFRRVHIATHGYFGGSAEDSYIMAYDDILNLNELQSYLSAESLDETPIELLTLSACQTAEGNDRAPLGFAGAALKAKAQTALGTLWPVSDKAAMNLMKTFYQGLNQPDLSKVKALQRAQKAIKNDPDLNHPFYWAPFTLVGNWK